MKRITVRSHRRKGRNVRSHTRKIYIPPGWKKVKFYDDKPYLATGIDIKGRVQYVYPKNFVKRQGMKKFKRVARLERKLPNIIDKIKNDARDDNVEAQATYTIYATGLRPGSHRDTGADKKAYGVITLRKRDVSLSGNDTVKFDFTGKKGVDINAEVKDKELHRIIKKRVKDNRLFDTTPEAVRKYFQKKAGNFKLKDLRTLKAIQVAKSEARKKNATKTTIATAVSEKLSNTPTVALQSYIPEQIVNKV